VLVVLKPKKYYSQLATAMAFFAVVGLVGYLSTGYTLSFDFSPHSLHALVGTITFLLSMYVYAFFNVFQLQKKKKYAKYRRLHVHLAKAAAVFAALALIGGLLMFLGTAAPPDLPKQQVLESVLPEVEATEYLGVELDSLSEQGNNAIKGTQYIDRESYSLAVTGLVDNELSLSYDELLVFPRYSEVAYMPCVEGWGFTAKWTGLRATDLLDRAGVTGPYVMFYASDGYSSGLPMEYLRENSVLLAYGINDLTLPADRGFPLQLVAKSKYGYKWVKWITRIEVVSGEEEGYWETLGYNNDATAGGPAFK
ncbi:molybdopterin-dependent oxidoreductase, partial [archaeon]